MAAALRPLLDPDDGGGGMSPAGGVPVNSSTGQYPRPGAGRDSQGLHAIYPIRTDEPSLAISNWTVGIGAAVFLLLAAALAVRVAPRNTRLRHFSTREAVLGLCGVTVVCCTIGIAGESVDDQVSQWWSLAVMVVVVRVNSGA